jgi:hypothetical protein
MSIEEPQRLGFPKIDHGVIVSRTKFPSDLGEYFCCHRSQRTLLLNRLNPLLRLATFEKATFNV